MYAGDGSQQDCWGQACFAEDVVAKKEVVFSGKFFKSLFSFSNSNGLSAFRRTTSFATFVSLVSSRGRRSSRTSDRVWDAVW